VGTRARGSRARAREPRRASTRVARDAARASAASSDSTNRRLDDALSAKSDARASGDDADARARGR
jgi:hypothetical protein